MSTKDKSSNLDIDKLKVAVNRSNKKFAIGVSPRNCLCKIASK